MLHACNCTPIIEGEGVFFLPNKRPKKRGRWALDHVRARRGVSSASSASASASAGAHPRGTLLIPDDHDDVQRVSMDIALEKYVSVALQHAPKLLPHHRGDAAKEVARRYFVDQYVEWYRTTSTEGKSWLGEGESAADYWQSRVQSDRFGYLAWVALWMGVQGPSSAAVERGFSLLKHLMKPRGSSLSWFNMRQEFFLMAHKETVLEWHGSRMGGGGSMESTVDGNE